MLSSGKSPFPARIGRVPCLPAPSLAATCKAPEAFRWSPPYSRNLTSPPTIPLVLLVSIDPHTTPLYTSLHKYRPLQTTGELLAEIDLLDMVCL